MKILLHIGMPKCGSSALQTFWSSGSFYEAAKTERTAYIAVHQDGQLWSGDELVSKASASAHGYLSSHSGSELAAMGVAKRRHVIAEIKAMAADYDQLIFSNEGWGPHPDEFIDDILFADPAFEVSILAYVRPQVEWMNSAWWQWGAWTDAPLNKWVNGNIAKANWNLQLKKWLQKSWVKRVDVRLLQGDVIQDFNSYAGISLNAGGHHNQGLPGLVLRLFQHHRKLRPGPHKSAIDFVLSRQLEMERGNTPWVIPPPMVSRLITAFHEDNQKLLDLLPPDQRDHMLQDHRWWDAEAYSSKTLSPPFVQRLNPNDLETLSVAALEAVFRMDEELRRLKKQLGNVQGDKQPRVVPDEKAQE